MNNDINDPNYTNKYMDIRQGVFFLEKSITENVGFLTVSEFNRQEGKIEIPVPKIELLDHQLNREEAKKQYWPFI